MFNLIGLGLTENSTTAQALKAISKSKIIYLEDYTADFPYSIKDLEKSIFGFNKNLEGTKRGGGKGGFSSVARIKWESLKPKIGKKKITPLTREQVESEQILTKAKNQNISLLVYGDPLSATTHISLIQSCKKQKIPFKIFHNSSIFTAVAETGLQLYKFGKTASMPAWQEDKNYKPTSFINIIKQNQKIKAHTLLLVDIGLSLEKAKEQLKKTLNPKQKIILCSQLGTNSKIYYNTLDKLPKTAKHPYCFIIPSDLHFYEEEQINF